MNETVKSGGIRYIHVCKYIVKICVAAGKEKGLNDMKNPLKQAVSEDFGAGYEKDEFALLAVGAEP